MGLIMRGGIPYGSVSEPQKNIDAEEKHLLIGDGNNWANGSNWILLDEQFNDSQGDYILKTIQTYIPNTYVDGTELQTTTNPNGLSLKAVSLNNSGEEQASSINLHDSAQINYSGQSQVNLTDNAQLYINNNGALTIQNQSTINSTGMSHLIMSDQANIQFTGEIYASITESAKLICHGSSITNIAGTAQISIDGTNTKVDLHGTNCKFSMKGNGDTTRNEETRLVVLDGAKIDITGSNRYIPDDDDIHTTLRLAAPEMFIHGKCQIHIDDGWNTSTSNYNYKPYGPKIYIHDCPSVMLDHEATIIGHDSAKIQFAGQSLLNLTGQARLSIEESAQLVMSTSQNGTNIGNRKSPVLRMGGAAMIAANGGDAQFGPYLCISPDQFLFNSLGFTGKISENETFYEIPSPEEIGVLTPEYSQYCNPQSVAIKVKHGEKFIDEDGRQIQSSYISNRTLQAVTPLLSQWVNWSEKITNRYDFSIDTYYVFTEEFYNSFVEKYKEKNNNKSPYGKTDFYIKILPTTARGADIFISYRTDIRGFVFNGMTSYLLEREFANKKVSYKDNTRTIYAIRVKDANQINADLNLIKTTMDLEELPYSEFKCFYTRAKKTDEIWSYVTQNNADFSLDTYIDEYLGDYLFKPKAEMVTNNFMPELTESCKSVFYNPDYYFTSVNNYLNLYDVYEKKTNNNDLPIKTINDILPTNNSPSNALMIIENNASVLIGGEKDSYSWLKIGGRAGDNTQVHFLDNSHTEIRQNSILSLRGMCASTLTNFTNEEGNNTTFEYYRPWSDYPYTQPIDGSMLTLYDNSVFTMRGVWDSSSIILPNGTELTPPKDWKEHPTKNNNSPLVEIIENTEVRLYGNIVIKANTVNDVTSITFGGTLSEGEVTFTIAELQALKNLLKT